MTIRTVGPNSTYPTIAAAVAAAAEGDIISFENGYSNERAVLTVQDLTVTGDTRYSDIELVLGVGIQDVTLDGLANIEVQDNGRNNAITGNAGNNVLRVARGTDTVLGGDGFDLLVVDYADAVTSVIGTATSVTDGTNSVTFDDSVEDFSILTGSGDDDVTAGTADGWNWVSTGDGNDTVTLADGINTVDSGAGNDTVTSGGYSEVRAGAGDDTVTTGDDGSIVNSGNGNNIVTTGAGADLLFTGSGNDSLMTGAGADEVRVNGGIDTLDAGLGEDLLTIQYGNLLTNVTANLTGGSKVNGHTGLADDGAGNSIDFSGVEYFHITTGSGNDKVRTGGGEDMLHTGAGSDVLIAGAGDDWLRGGAGNDTLSGGRGKDFLVGGEGADHFRFDDLDSFPSFQFIDVISDLQGKDTIDVSRIDANVNEVGDQAFVMVERFSGTAGEAVIIYPVRDSFSGEPLGTTKFAFDTDGDARSDIAIIAYDNKSHFDNFLL